MKYSFDQFEEAGELYLKLLKWMIQAVATDLF